MRRSTAIACNAAFLLAMSNSLWAGQQYQIQSNLQPGDTSGIEVRIDVGGKAKITEEGKLRELPMQVVGQLKYEERLLALAGSDPFHRRSARHYSDATATIKIDKAEHKPAMRADRRTIAASLSDDRATMFSPGGPLSREELDLIDIVGNSLLVELLLPSEAVEIGDTWKHEDRLLAMLLCLDAVKESDVSSKLDVVSGDLCKITLTGTVQGAIGGVSTDIKIQARYNFSLKQQRVTWFAAAIEEKRSVGHVGPGLDIVATVKVQVTPNIRAQELTDELVAELPTEQPSSATILEYIAKPAGFRLLHDPRWHVTRETADLAVMRLVDRGELIAQCNISPLKKLPEGANTSLEDFQSDIKRSLGEGFADFSQASESSLDDGSRLLSVVAVGKAAELDIHWHYYLMIRPTGERVAFAFTVEANLAERLAEADRLLVAGLEMLESSTAQQQTGSVRK